MSEPEKPELLHCFHCGAETELRCSDCAIENELTHEGQPVCSAKKCRDSHDQWHKRHPSISDLEGALDAGAEIEILPNGRIVVRESESPKSLTFRNNLGGEYGVAA